MFKLLFEFKNKNDCDNFWAKLYHPDSAEELIEPYEIGGKFNVGFDSAAPLDDFRITSTYECWLNICHENNGQLKECKLSANNT